MGAIIVGIVAIICFCIALYWLDEKYGSGDESQQEEMTEYGIAFERGCKQGIEEHKKIIANLTEHEMIIYYRTLKKEYKDQPQD